MIEPQVPLKLFIHSSVFFYDKLKNVGNLFLDQEFSVKIKNIQKVGIVSNFSNKNLFLSLNLFRFLQISSFLQRCGRDYDESTRQHAGIKIEKKAEMKFPSWCFAVSRICLCIELWRINKTRKSRFCASQLMKHQNGSVIIAGWKFQSITTSPVKNRLKLRACPIAKSSIIPVTTFAIQARQWSETIWGMIGNVWPIPTFWQATGFGHWKGSARFCWRFRLCCSETNNETS